MSKLYHDLASWWPLLCPVDDYTEEAAFFRDILVEAGLPSALSLLELGRRYKLSNRYDMDDRISA
jgi:hypothetical protein